LAVLTCFLTFTKKSHFGINRIPAQHAHSKFGANRPRDGRETWREKKRKKSKSTENYNTTFFCRNGDIKIFTSAEGENSHSACVIADLIFDLTKIEQSNLITDQRHLIDDQSWWNEMCEFDLRFDRFDL